MSYFPTEVRRLPNALMISWSDGVRSELSAKLLRDTCPCASCREERGDNFHSNPLNSDPTPPGKGSLLRVVEHSIDQQIQIEQVTAVGNYAISIKWGDGHSSGIYTFEHLHALSLTP